jgi:uncharacterized membrane protein
MGWKLGHVPVLIPFAWLSMLYPAHIMARLVLDGRVLHVSYAPVRVSVVRERRRNTRASTTTNSAKRKKTPPTDRQLSVWRFAQRTMLLSSLSALMMTAWDLPMDPAMVEEGYWVWKEGGAFFGVPFQNFVGWFLLGFLICTLFQVFEYVRSSAGERHLAVVRRRRHSRLFLCLPVLA